MLSNGRMPLIDERNLAEIARRLARQDPDLAKVMKRHGPPPLWARKPGFATLLQIILEQQVSLASAKACFDKLRARVGELTPQNLLMSSDDELKKDGFSRQKTAYARHLATAVIENQIDLQNLSSLPDADVKLAITKLKGVGEWTSDIYLLMALRRPDVMPKGDLALHIAWQRLSGHGRPNASEFLEIAERWRPFRSVAARLLWHYYLCERRAKKSDAG